MTYPHIRRHHLKEELTEHFSIDAEDYEFLKTIRKSEARLGCAVLLKTFLFLGYPPRVKSDVPLAVVAWIAQQMDFQPKLFRKYQWKDRLWNHHLSLIRQHTGFRLLGSSDQVALVDWLAIAANLSPSRKELFAVTIARCRERRLELPAEKELWRLVNSARRRFFDTLHHDISGRIETSVRGQMDRCLAPSDAGTSQFEWIKSPPGPNGMRTILEEVDKLRFLQQFGVEQGVQTISPKVLWMLRDRARSEGGSQMRRQALPPGRPVSCPADGSYRPHRENLPRTHPAHPKEGR